MADDSPAPRSEAKRDGLEFSAEAWVGEPDNRTHAEFVEAKAKVALWLTLIVLGGLAVGCVGLSIFGLARYLVRF
jgi:hypothetical protein